MWQYPQQKTNCGVSAWKNKEHRKKNLDIMFEKIIYEENLSGRYERRNRSVSAV